MADEAKCNLLSGATTLIKEKVRYCTKPCCLLGRGGFAQVYKGEILDEALDSKVAVKRITNIWEWGDKEKTLNEPKLLSICAHSNILRYRFCFFEADLL